MIITEFKIIICETKDNPAEKEQRCLHKPKYKKQAENNCIMINNLQRKRNTKNPGNCGIIYNSFATCQ